MSLVPSGGPLQSAKSSTVRHHLIPEVDIAATKLEAIISRVAAGTP